MKAKKILIGILAVVMMLSFAGCSEGDPTATAENTNTPTSAASSEPENTPDSGNTVVYELPAGAASEYELYETVVDFLNNGFHYDDLKDVFDLNLTIAFYSKCERKPEEIFTLGLKYDEASDLIARLRKKAANMDFLIDDYGEIDMDYIDYDAFISEFTESIRSQIDLEDSDFENFIENILYCDELFPDGENPFDTDQTEWEKKSEAELETYEYDDYENWDKDLFLNFPRIYGIELGTYISGDATSMYIRYTEIDGRYYLVNFSYSTSGIGG